MGMFDTPDNASPDLEKQAGNEAQGAEGQVTETTQTQQAAEGQQQPPEEGNGEQQLILGKYKTQDELVKAHEAMQKRLVDMRNELGNLRKQAQQVQQPAQPQQAQPQEPGAWTPEQWQQWNTEMDGRFRQYGWQAVAEFVAQVAHEAVRPITESQAKENAVNGELSYLLEAVDEEGQPVFPDAETLDVDGFLDRHPYFLDLLAEQGGKRARGQLAEGELGALEVLYKAIKADTAQALGQQAFQNGLQQGARQAQAKGGAALPKPGTKNSNVNPSPEEQVVNEIFAHKKGGFFI